MHNFLFELGRKRVELNVCESFKYFFQGLYLCILKIESPTTNGRVDCLKKRLWGDTHYLLKLDTAAVNGTEWERLVNFVTCLLSAAFIFLPFISSIYIYQRRSQWPLCAGVNAHALCLSLAKAGLLLQRCNHQGVLPWTFEDSETHESAQTANTKQAEMWNKMQHNMRSVGSASVTKFKHDSSHSSHWGWGSALLVVCSQQLVSYSSILATAASNLEQHST